MYNRSRICYQLVNVIMEAAEAEASVVCELSRRHNKAMGTFNIDPYNRLVNLTNIMVAESLETLLSVSSKKYLDSIIDGLDSSDSTSTVATRRPLLAMQLEIQRGRIVFSPSLDLISSSIIESVKAASEVMAQVPCLRMTTLSGYEEHEPPFIVTLGDRPTKEVTEDDGDELQLTICILKVPFNVSCRLFQLMSLCLFSFRQDRSMSHICCWKRILFNIHL